MSLRTSNFELRLRHLLLLLVGNLLVLTVLCSPNKENRKSPFSIPSTCSISPSSSRSLFGVRGGGFFGFGQRSSQGGGGGDDDPPQRGKFPALTRDEIEEKLNIPVFGITDVNGNGVILSDDGRNIFHFFFSKHMADAALKAVASANVGAPELKVSAFHLGKCWFRLIDSSGSKMFKVNAIFNSVTDSCAILGMFWLFQKTVFNFFVFLNCSSLSATKIWLRQRRRSHKTSSFSPCS